MNEFIEQFLLESRELIEQATASLLALEENPGDTEQLDSAFRAFHTLKGSAAIVDFPAMARATHVVEDALAAVRSGATTVTRGLVSNCLACLDQIVQWLNAMQVSGEIPIASDTDADAVVRRFESTKSATTVRDSAAEQGHFSERGGKLSAAAIALLKAQIALLSDTAQDGMAGRILSAGRVAVNILRSLNQSDGLSALEKMTGEAAAAADPEILSVVLHSLVAQHNSAPEETVGPGIAVADTAARVLRVDVERVDALVKLTGELTVAKNAVGHAARLARSGADQYQLSQLLKDQHAILGRLIEKLQRSVLSIRVLPLRHVFNRFPRLVREVAETLDKSVRIVTEGDATEADKVVVEHLFEPLLHIIRNALDHGVESANERSAAGKPATAVIHLRASRAGDVVLVEVEDDGRGIDVAKVRQLAISRGLAEPDVITSMPDENVVDLLFAAGFSTAEKITDLSGRGVGMDVVRSTVERLGGEALIASRPGRGTTVTLKLPFSIMMTRVMTVEAGGQIFGIPLDNVVETVRIPRSQISAIGAAQAFVLRDHTIPLVDLGRTLGKNKEDQKRTEANIVVVSIGGLTGSVEVDRFGDRMDVMLKPMDGLLQGAPGVAGTSLMGDGGVLIVLDLQDLLQ